MPNETPTGIITRNVLVGTYSWTSASTSIVAMDPLLALVNSSLTVQKVLGDLDTIPPLYRYLRCSWKITVRVNSTPYHQGTLAAYWQPPMNAVVVYSSPFEFMMCRPVILSASLQDSAEIEIPYISHKPHIDLLNYTSLVDTPKFSVRVLNPLLTSSSSVTDTVAVSIFLQMMNPQLYAYIPVPPPIPNKSNSSRKVMQSQSSGQNKHKQNKEAQTKDKKGLSAASVVDAISPITNSVPLMTPLLKLGASLFDNLDKPSTDQSVTFVATRRMRGHTMLTGVDYCEPLSQFPAYSVAKDMDMPNSDMKVVEYAQIPSLFYMTTAVNAGVVATLPISPIKIATSQTLKPDYLMFATMQYQYWRGSIRYLIHLVGTAFYSCRFRFSISYSLSPPTTIEEGSAYHSKIVDAKGDAWTTITVPYLSPTIWSKVSAQADHTMWLTIEALTDVQGSSLPADAIYYVNIYRAAGNDYQLACLRRGDQTPWSTSMQATKDMKSQCSLVNKFAESFDPITDGSHGMQEHGLLMGDTSSTISDTLKAFYPTNATKISFPEASGTTLNWPVHRWALGFAFWRGSRRIRTMTSATFAGMQSPTGNFTVASSALLSMNEPTSLLSTVIPWYSTVAWYPTISNGVPATLATMTDQPIDIVTTDTDGTTLWFSAGDDFTYLWPVPPLLTFVQPTPVVEVTSTAPVIKGGRLPPNSHTSGKKQFNNADPPSTP
jgi:hypothetical protein